MDSNEEFNFKKYQKYKKKYLMMKKILNKVGGSFSKYKKTIDEYLKKPNNITLQEISTINDKLTIELLIKYLNKQKDLSNEKYDVNLSVYSFRVETLIKELVKQKRKIESETKSQKVDDKSTTEVKKVQPISPTIGEEKKEETTSSVPSSEEKKEESTSSLPSGEEKGAETKIIKLGLSSSGATGKETKEEIKKIKMYEEFKNKLAGNFYLWFYKKKRDGIISTTETVDPVFFEPNNLTEEKNLSNLINSLPEDSIERYSSVIIPFDWYEKYDFYMNSEDGMISWFK
tara:strand:+ start:84 stop:944 length:861 start_codon:yes stop_codon:yes gene_type:complete